MKTPKEKVFFDGSSYFESMLKDIERAKMSIDLETYIFNLDLLGKKILTLLEKCAKQNIKVRVLVDGAGTPQWGGELVKRFEKAGGETRIFHPFPWRLWQWSRGRVRVPSVLKAIYLLLKINSRNHRKTCIIDNEIVYVGSFNIDVRHLTREKAGDGWHDAGVRLQGFNIANIKHAFESAWSYRLIQERFKRIFKGMHLNPIIRLNNSRHRRRILYKNLLDRIKNCKHRVWITNAYFIPDNFLLKSLKEAAGLGVDVKILLPRKSDVLFMPWASAIFYNSLLQSGVRIFEYLPSVLHAKTLILDDWITIGSSNLNHRSLLHDLEVDVNIRKESSKIKVEKQFRRDLKSAKEIKLSHLEKRSLYQRIIGRLLLYVKYLI